MHFLELHLERLTKIHVMKEYNLTKSLFGRIIPHQKV
jgi:hypothetical protein